MKERISKQKLFNMITYDYSAAQRGKGQILINYRTTFSLVQHVLCFYMCSVIGHSVVVSAIKLKLDASDLLHNKDTRYLGKQLAKFQFCRLHTMQHSPES